jgi:hypothetical protein
MRRWMLTALIAVAVMAAALGQSCNTYSQQQAEEVARYFVKNSATFKYDSMDDTLKLVNSEELEENFAWRFTYEFQSRHAGYGDRAGQVLAQVITPHEAVITVEENTVTSAVMDGRWNMLEQSMIFTEENSRQLADEFVRNSPTFKFDGIEDSLKLVETLYSDIENAWQFVFQFESRHAGYGNRTGQMLAQVITPHEAIITVEDGEVKSAVIDEKWDMINQRMF